MRLGGTPSAVSVGCPDSPSVSHSEVQVYARLSKAMYILRPAPGGRASPEAEELVLPEGLEVYFRSNKDREGDYFPGFFGVVFVNREQRKAVFGYCGTKPEHLCDVFSDLELLWESTPVLTDSALNFFERGRASLKTWGTETWMPGFLAQDLSRYDLRTTGHSLGGALAALVAAKKLWPLYGNIFSLAVVFDAPGVSPDCFKDCFPTVPFIDNFSGRITPISAWQHHEAALKSFYRPFLVQLGKDLRRPQDFLSAATVQACRKVSREVGRRMGGEGGDPIAEGMAGIGGAIVVALVARAARSPLQQARDYIRRNPRSPLAEAVRWGDFLTSLRHYHGLDTIVVALRGGKIYPLEYSQWVGFALFYNRCQADMMAQIKGLPRDLYSNAAELVMAWQSGELSAGAAAAAATDAL